VGDDRPRLLARRSEHAYTSAPQLALHAEPEAVDEQTQRELTRRAHRREADRLADVWREGRELIVAGVDLVMACTAADRRLKSDLRVLVASYRTVPILPAVEAALVWLLERELAAGRAADPTTSSSAPATDDLTSIATSPSAESARPPRWPGSATSRRKTCAPRSARSLVDAASTRSRDRR
jgi:hypothetical protein